MLSMIYKTFNLQGTNLIIRLQKGNDIKAKLLLNFESFGKVIPCLIHALIKLQLKL